jgi:hypothetical protein
MLRESSQHNSALNLQATVNPDADSGVEEGALMIAFAEAAVRRGENLPDLRDEIAKRLGDQAAVDAAGIVANFQRMVRIADGCGIPLDDFTKDATADVREGLGIHEYASAANTA